MDKGYIVGTLVLISAIIGGAVILDDNVPIYQCKSRGVATTCYKFSSPKAELGGLSTWCYYNESSKSYYVCPEGWEKFEKNNVFSANNEVYYCPKNNSLIKECITDKGLVLYRIKNG